MRTDAGQEKAPVRPAGLSRVGTRGKRIVIYAEKEVIFSQGDPCDSVMYLRRGGIQISVLSHVGKVAIVALVAGDFLGEGPLAEQPVRLKTAIATMPSEVLIVPKCRRP